MSYAPDFTTSCVNLQIWINSPNRDKLENFSQLSAPLTYLGYQSQVNYNLFYRLGVPRFYILFRLFPGQ